MFRARRISFVFIIFSVLALISVVQAQNSPPVVDVGPDQNVIVGDAVLLQGNATDPDNDEIVD